MVLYYHSEYLNHGFVFDLLMIKIQTTELLDKITCKIAKLGNKGLSLAESRSYVYIDGQALV